MHIISIEIDSIDSQAKIIVLVILAFEINIHVNTDKIIFEHCNLAILIHAVVICAHVK